MSTPFWASAFLDLPSEAHSAGTAFWSAVTGWPVSDARGEHGEFTTLVPPAGDPHLKIQRTGASSPATHLDLHVADRERGIDRALDRGAALVHRSPHGYAVLTSPGGYAFCLVTERRSSPAPAATWADGSRSLVDQLCLDIPSSGFETETAFWRDLTGWELRPSRVRPEFRYLVRPAGIPLRLLLQRLEDTEGTVRGHLDLATTDRSAEVDRHTRLGATVASGQAGTHWTVMRDPTGAAYCITDRDPVTGTLG